MEDTANQYIVLIVRLITFILWWTTSISILKRDDPDTIHREQGLTERFDEMKMIYIIYYSLHIDQLIKPKEVEVGVLDSTLHLIIKPHEGICFKSMVFMAPRQFQRL